MVERVPGKYERLWRERHDRDLALSLHPGGHHRGLRFDLAAGMRAVKFIEGYCQHHKGEWAGKPMLLEDWQRDVLSQIFGWLRADGTRRYRTAYVEIPRKNGKSQKAAGVGLFLTVADGEPGAEVYSSATKRDQARIVWSEAAATVKSSPKLKRFVKAYRNSITVERTGSKFEPLSADSNTLDGLNPHGNVVDELHAHKDRGVWDVLDTAMGARRQPLTLAITTAGKYEPEGIGWQMHDYAVKVLEGVIDDDSFFAFIAAADEPQGDQLDYYFTEKAQRQANPNWGVSVKPDYLAKQAEKAQSQPSFLNEYLRLHLNVWTRTVTRWLSLERWADSEPAPGLDARPASIARELSLAGRQCFGGLDLSTKLDLCAFGLVFPGENGFIDVVCRFWLPEQTMANYAKKGQRHYETWAREGWLTTTPGNVIDYEFIRSEVNKLSKVFAVQQIAFDPWGATDLANRLTADGLTMVECRQGFQSLSEPSKDLEARVIEKKVRHANNPILRFCVSNAVVRRDPAGNIKPDKEKAVDRIDGVVAVIMALGRCITTPIEGEHAYVSSGFKQL
jgi:phage terminase large subunit-like protein